MSELNIYYTGGFNTALDDDMHAIAKKHGYEFIGSGQDFTGTRDLSFEKEKEPSDAPK